MTQPFLRQDFQPHLWRDFQPGTLVILSRPKGSLSARRVNGRQRETSLPNEYLRVQITVYDGAGIIGGNKILLEADDTAVFLDFGINYDLRGRYFEEFLKPRSNRGLTDLFELGLLPPVKGLYREDLELPGEDLWGRVGRGYRSSDGKTVPVRDAQVDALFLSHGHMDHSGHISFLRGDLPIYTRALTAFLTKAIQDSSQSDLEREVCYISPKILQENGYLASSRQDHAIQRPFVLVDADPATLSSSALEFWGKTQGSKGFQSTPLVQAKKARNLPFRFFPVDHSIFGASAFAFETSGGYVIYTGDLRMHGTRCDLTQKFAEEAARLKPLLLLTEGTHLETKTPVKEEEVKSRSLEVVRSCRKLVIADFGPRNVERLLTFLEIARECQRKLVLLDKDLYLLEAIHHANPHLLNPAEEPQLFLYDERKAMKKWAQEIFSRYQEIVTTPEEIRSHQEEYILCFSFWDMNKLVDLRPDPGGMYLYSSSEAFSEEQAIDIKRLREWLAHFSLKPVGVPFPSETPGALPKILEEEKGFHASGHITGPHLLQIIEAINPQIIIPIHTQTPKWFEGHLGKKHRIIIPERGVPITL